jgi:CheY-like chemotaxis protein
VGKIAFIVDDDRAIVDGLGEYLEGDGYDVVGATNASEALAMLDSGLRPDVIVLDLHMPGMDGWDFRTAQLNEPSLAEIPTLILSASDFSRQTVLTELAVDEYLSKPVDPATVASVLDNLRAIKAALN